MHRFEIFVAQNPIERAFEPAPPASEPSSGPRRPRRRAREVLDIFLSGANVTARVQEAEVSSVLRDIGRAVALLAKMPGNKAIVRFYDEPWELTIERFGKVAALSVYRAGSEPVVAAYDQEVSFVELCDGVLDAVTTAATKGTAPKNVVLDLQETAAQLRALDRASLEGDVPRPSTSPVVIEVDRDVPVAFGAELHLRRAQENVPAASHGVERADLHALLFKGQLRAEVRGKAVTLGEGHPFLFAEQLVELGARALEVWEAGHETLLRANAGGTPIALRIASSGDAALTLVGSNPVAELPPSYTFPSLSVPDFVEASLSFGRAIARAVLRRDRKSSMNLRL